MIRPRVTLLLVMSLLTTISVSAQAKAASKEDVRQIVREELNSRATKDAQPEATRQNQPITVTVTSKDSEHTAWTTWVTAFAPLITSLVALGGVFWSSQRSFAASRSAIEAAQESARKTLESQDQHKYMETVLDGLKFFGSNQGTQSRGVGIAIIKANAQKPEFEKYKAIWCFVLEGQALFLLTGSKEEDRPEEIANLGAIIGMIKELRDSSFDTKPIKDALLINTERLELAKARTEARRKQATNGRHEPVQPVGLDLTGDSGKAVAAAIDAL